MGICRGQRGWWVTASSSRRGGQWEPGSPEGHAWRILCFLGAWVPHPPLDKSLSCSPRVHSGFHAQGPPAGVKGTGAWGSSVCRWEKLGI